MSFFSSVTMMNQALDYHIQRQNLLTANLAHVDTPGYKTKELYRTDSFGDVLNIAMEATHEGHLSGARQGQLSWEVRPDPNAPVGADGNSVNLDREAVKVASNNLRYDAISQMVKGSLDAMVWATRDGKG